MSNIYFISDIHLDINNSEVTKRFLDFIDKKKSDMKELYILGDLFEFWIDDKYDIEQNNIIIDINIAYGGMDSIPNFAFKTQKYLIGKEFNLKNIDKSKQMIEKDFTPLTDVRASSTYRKLVSKNLMDRLFLEINNNKIRI